MVLNKDSGVILTFNIFLISKNQQQDYITEKLSKVTNMNPYVNFINLVNGILLSGKFPKLSPLEKLILDQIATHEQAENLLTVRTLIGFEQIASPATIHKHLSRLRKLGYVVAKTNDNDKRAKHLVLSPLGHQYINTLSKAIVKAAIS